MGERWHKHLKDSVGKMCGENGSKWKEYLPLLKFADQISTKQTTGYSPFQIQCGQRAVKPIYIETKTYLAIEWHKLSPKGDLLKARATQLSGKEEMRKRAEKKLRKSREDSIKYWDKRLAHKIRKSIEPVEIVLVYNRTLESQLGMLFRNRFTGPYWVLKQISNGLYELENPYGTRLAKIFAASQIKSFYPRGDPEESRSGEENEELE
ncbi:hypothetical protein O181_094173 [Austropuccinia psidii MF-1]|uniref:Uncharacterized protein n=1 Tax=Austropuccinia psidii MF-1 TaxID=1389203 RepID=A0A9Q3J2M9_9BASI|nr:hypothetical protein [Austropuccinia psidii MF-1]